MSTLTDLGLRQAARTIADAMESQKPKLVVVPIFLNLTDRELTAEEAHRMAEAMKTAFEEAVK